MMRFSLRLFLTLFFALSISSCTSSDDDEDTGHVRFVNTLSSELPVDVIKDAGILAPNLRFLEWTDYEHFSSSDPHEVEINLAGTFSRILDVAVSVGEGTEHTFLVTGTAKKARALILKDDNSSPADDRTRLRFVNAVDTGVTVDAYVVARDGSGRIPAVRGIRPISSSDYIDGTPGEYYFSFVNSKDNQELARTSVFNLSDGEVRTIVLASGVAAYFTTVLLDVD